LSATRHSLDIFSYLFALSYYVNSVQQCKGTGYPRGRKTDFRATSGGFDVSRKKRLADLREMLKKISPVKPGRGSVWIFAKKEANVMYFLQNTGSPASVFAEKKYVAVSQKKAIQI
jgi:hypothetical protein